MIIPRIAYLYWSGGEIPWLRAQTLTSFLHYHPGWEVILGTPDEKPPNVPKGVRVVRDEVTDPRLPANVRSDVWRWLMLAERGGVYLDMDIIFLRALDPLFKDETKATWMTLDLGTPCWQSGRRWGPGSEAQRRIVAVINLSIGVLASSGNNRYFRRLWEIAKTTPGRTGYFEKNPSASQDYQSHGTHLVAAHWDDLAPETPMGNIPGAAFYRGSSAKDVRRLWRQAEPFGAEEFGVHWYGGSPESVQAALACGVEDIPLGTLRNALERFLAIPGPLPARP